MLKKMDSEISCSARKLPRILWLKKANQDTPVIEKKKSNWKKKEKNVKKKMGTKISHGACKLSRPPRLLKKKEV